MFCTGLPPAPCTNHLSTLIDNKLVVAGGYNINGALLADIHVLDLAGASAPLFFLCSLLGDPSF